MLGISSQKFCIPGWLENIKMNKQQTLIQISYKVQELCGLSLTDHNMLDKSISVKWVGWHAIRYGMLTCICISILYLSLIFVQHNVKYINISQLK